MVAAFVLVRLSRIVIGRFFVFTRIDVQKRGTLQTVLCSTVRYAVYFFATLMILPLFGVQIQPLLAGIGVVGVALGFGTQSLVRDIITGFFIIFEDQLHVGDYVEINGVVKGTVEEVGLRMTSVREWSGRKYYLANGEIKNIRNYNREQLRAIVTAKFAYSEDPLVIRQVLQEVCNSIRESNADDLLRGADGNFVEAPRIYGVTGMEAGAQYTITAQINPSSLWTVETAMREALLARCRERGISLV